MNLRRTPTKDISQKESVHFIQVLDEFLRRDYKSLLFDGLHPNTKGHGLLFELIKDQLEMKGVLCEG